MFVQSFLYRLSPFSLGSIKEPSSPLPLPPATLVPQTNSIRQIDPISRALSDPNDYRVIVVDSIMKGLFSEMIEEQKPMPAVTWLGDLMDWVFGWGQYYTTSEKAGSIGKRNLQAVAQEEKQYYCGSEHIASFVDTTVQTSFVMQRRDNLTCALKNPEGYNVTLYGLPKGFVPSALYCRVQKCVDEAIRACQPNCFPCESRAAADSLHEETYYKFRFKAEHIDNLFWNGLVYFADGDDGSRLRLDINRGTFFKKREGMSTWKLAQIEEYFKRVIQDCERSQFEEERKEKMGTRLYIAMTSVGLVAVFCLKRCMDYRNMKMKGRSRTKKIR